jgi:hypothetical protein
MLQWNPKLTLLVVLMLLVAISAAGGMVDGGSANFTW